jgi:hypothetical protein
MGWGWSAVFKRWVIRGFARRGYTVERRRRGAKAVRDLSHADVRIGEHRLGGLYVVVREFRRTRATFRLAGRPRLPGEAA